MTVIHMSKSSQLFVVEINCSIWVAHVCRSGTTDDLTMFMWLTHVQVWQRQNRETVQVCQLRECSWRVVCSAFVIQPSLINCQRAVSVQQSGALSTGRSDGWTQWDANWRLGHCRHLDFSPSSLNAVECWTHCYNIMAPGPGGAKHVLHCQDVCHLGVGRHR